MAIPTKEFLSGGTGDGRPIAVAAEASAGTIIHTAHATAKDESYIYACNIHTAAVLLTIEKGGTGTSDQLVFNIPAQSGLYIMTPGTPLSGGLVIRAFAEAGMANKINIDGFVNRIT